MGISKRRQWRGRLCKQARFTSNGRNLPRTRISIIATSFIKPTVPESIIIARLEGGMLLLDFTNNSWFALEKINHVDTPSNIQQIKDGNMKSYINTLKEFKEYCLNLKNQSMQVAFTKIISKEDKKAWADLHQRSIWFSDFVSEDE